jgi:methyl-accepting chemotaxis protein
MSSLDTLQKILKLYVDLKSSKDVQQKCLEELTDATGSVLTVFKKDANSDFVRVATTVRVQDGSFAVGTKLDRAGKAYAAVSKGKNYPGVVSLFGKKYYSLYNVSKDGKTVRFVSYFA